MVWVKVCGITDETARDTAVEAGADAVGFVLIDGSPRRIAIADAAALIDGTPIGSYVLTAEADVDHAMDIVARTGATGVQPYGPSARRLATTAIRRGLDVLYPVAVGDDGLPADLDIPEGAVPLFDTAAADRLGGTGRSFAWEALDSFRGRFVLAGGLGPDNVSDAVRTARPFGVDASSRLEASPGVKDPDTIRAYIQEAKAT